MPYKIYKNTSFPCLASSINIMPIQKWKLVLNKAICVSFFCSLVMNSFPLSLNNLEENSSSNDTSNVLLDTNGESINSSDYAIDFQVVDGLSKINNKVRMISEDINKQESEYHEEFFKNIYEFMDRENLSIESLQNLLNSMVSVNGPFGQLYSNYRSALQSLLRENKSYEMKFLIIMARDGYTYEQLDYMCAGITGESVGDGHCYADAYAVASTLVNRSHSDWYVNQYGHNFYSIFKAPGQYEIEISGNYLKFLGAIHLEGYKAAIDALYTRKASHSWIQFRANWVELNCQYDTFAPKGNKFIDKMDPSEYVPYPDEEIALEDVKVFLNRKVNFKK